MAILKPMKETGQVVAFRKPRRRWANRKITISGNCMDDIADKTGALHSFSFRTVGENAPINAVNTRAATPLTRKAVPTP